MADNKCMKCGEDTDSPNYPCEKCQVKARKKSQANREYYQKNHAKVRKQQQDRRERLMEAGLCRDCGKPRDCMGFPETSSLYCPICLDKRVKQNSYYRWHRSGGGR